MNNINTGVLRARTVMTFSGTRVNWRNVSYFEIKDTDSNTIGIKWKFKASIRTEIVEINPETDYYKYFKQYGLVKFEDTFVNLYKILTIDEEPVHGPIEHTKVRIVFTDGFELTRTLRSADWVWWKTTYA